MKNNKLIAEFLGFQQTNIGWYDAEEVLLRTEIDNTFDNLKFHTDWNWLMQVVEKIENLQYKNNNDVFKVVIDYGSCIIYNMINDLDILFSVNSIYKIQATYNACVEFIKWYNEQNK
jgi:hypothetical protein